MTNTMRRLFFSLLVLFLLNGCYSTNANEDLFDFKGSFIGDNSAVGNIVKHLPNGEHLKGFELKTKEEPYGIILNYEGIEAEEIEKKYKETAIYNATFIFALVQNAEWVTFKFEDQVYQLTKENLQHSYGADLSDYSSEDDLKKRIQKYLEDENKGSEIL
ncbi:protein of unknown function [Halobacillus karajensis]|uniref:DUF4825 domain-containing protein n=1 Tax=Halobacillus karajensis TaxID=195088 RepID=UPI0008A79CC1|nr:DUF4825 domain-containing protein [Halobacillus karajensis]SEI00235.1 protein of unknown function [Halobacillus karajensis]